MYHKVIAAAVQFTPLTGAVGKNLAVARQLAFEAALGGANLIVLPELCTAGPDLLDVRTAAMCSQSANGAQTQAIVEIAVNTRSAILFGYVEAAEGAFYNSALLAMPDGRTYNFRKRNLWGNDYFWATPGQMERGEVVVTPWGRIGVLVCRDVENAPRKSVAAHLDRFYHRGSVDILCVPTMWDTTYEFPDSSWVELAEQVSCHVIVSNVSRAEDENTRGGPCIIDRSLRVYAPEKGDMNRPVTVGALLNVDAFGEI